MAAKTALLLTGVPGVGKTTLMRKVAAALGSRTVRGFVTEEIRKRGKREGFRIESFDGRRGILAHVELDSSSRVGRYGVDVAALDEVVARALADEGEVYLVDEIGKMECFSQRFQDAITGLLDSHRPLVATVALRAGGFVARVKRRNEVEVWEVTRANRDELPDQVLEWLGRRLG